jgi:hypothetical protein
MQIVRDLNTIFSENVVEDSQEQLGCSVNEVPEQSKIHVGDVTDDVLDVEIVDPLVHDTSADMENYDRLVYVLNVSNRATGRCNGATLVYGKKQKV